VLPNKKTRAEAEAFKSSGNAHMQKKEYDDALDCYTQALRLCPNGPQSHVYFSNRAAALLSMKMFDQAILDSERALSLAPTYGKAHARLGLAHFLLGDYRRAMEAYTVALKYEPDNKSSKSYLEKAAKKLARQGEIDHGGELQSSFSVVSEWDKSKTSKEHERGSSHHRQIGRSSSGVGNDASLHRKEKRSSSLHRKEKRSASLHRRESRKGKPGMKNHMRDMPGLAFEAAEEQKVCGNSQMASRDYQSALESYSTAIELSPDGPQSHVYYSNRAAALCYLQRYEEAVKDSERAIRLQPAYGKAHARLGLSKFFLEDYEGSIIAYETALCYDPDNASNKSYLAKAQIRLERQQQEQELQSFNVAAEARRLIADPDMMHMAKKMMGNGSSNGVSDKELMEDPEMKRFARKAISDPVMFEAMQNIQSMNSKSGPK